MAYPIPELAKDALRDGGYLKRYRMSVLDADGNVEFEISNENLIEDSVSIDERLCSTDVLKFGLCEGSTLEFQYFGFGNIRNREVVAYIDVEYVDANKDVKWHTIPMGHFTCKQCPVQASTGIRKAVCYNKLQSEYLDTKANDSIKEAVAEGDYGTPGTASTQTILDKLLDGFRIDSKPNLIIDYDPFKVGTQFFNLSAYTEVVDGHGSNNYFLSKSYGRGLAVAGGFDDSDYYRVILNAKKIYDYIYEKRKPFVVDSEGNPKKYFSGNLSPSHSGSPIFTLIDSIIGNLNVYEEKKSSPIYRFIIDKNSPDTLTTPWISNIREIILNIYVSFEKTNTYRTSITSTDDRQMEIGFDQMVASLGEFCVIEKRALSQIEKVMVTNNEAKNLPDVTLRQLQSSVYELNAQFGQLDRNTDLFSGVELNGRNLFPREGLHPTERLYPYGSKEITKRSTYSKLWTDSVGTQSFRNLIVTYKTVVDGEEKDIKIERVVNENGTQDYEMADNWLLRNLVWTEAQVNEYLDIMIEKMRNLTWFPFEMWGAGLPYLETGDQIAVTSPDGTYTTYIFQRQLSGIQSLQDKYTNGTLDVF